VVWGKFIDLRELWDTLQSKISFSHHFQKNFLIILLFQYFFINLPMLTASETLSADTGCEPWGSTNMQKPAEGGKELLMRSDLTVGNHLWIRRLLDALFLTLGNFANFHRCQEWGNGRCPWVCNHQPAVYLIVYKVCQRCDIHTGVGFCVARSTTMGNAKASERGTGDGMTPTLFSYMYYEQVSSSRESIYFIV